MSACYKNDFCKGCYHAFFPAERFVFAPATVYKVEDIWRFGFHLLYYSVMYAVVAVGFLHCVLKLYSSDCCRYVPIVYGNVSNSSMTIDDLTREVREDYTMIYTGVGIVIISAWMPGPITRMNSKGSCAEKWRGNARNAFLYLHLIGVGLSYYVFSEISDASSSADVWQPEWGWPIVGTVIATIVLAQTRTKKAVTYCCCSQKAFFSLDYFPEDLVLNTMELIVLAALLYFLDTVTCWEKAVCDPNFKGSHFHHYQYGLILAKLSSYAGLEHEEEEKAGKNEKDSDKEAKGSSNVQGDKKGADDSKKPGAGAENKEKEGAKEGANEQAKNPDHPCVTCCKDRCFECCSENNVEFCECAEDLCCNQNLWLYKSVHLVFAFVLCGFHSLGVALFFHGLINYGPDRWRDDDYIDYTYKIPLLRFAYVCICILIFSTKLPAHAGKCVKEAFVNGCCNGNNSESSIIGGGQDGYGVLTRGGYMRVSTMQMRL